MIITTRTDKIGTIIKENQHGFLHCEDGPARIFEDGAEQFWLNGWPYNNFDEYAADAGWTTDQIVEHKLMNQTKNLL